jgi:hypothetical protein
MMEPVFANLAEVVKYKPRRIKRQLASATGEDISIADRVTDTAVAPASGQTALLITDGTGNAARERIRDILLSETDFGIKDVICLEVSPEGSISDIKAVSNAMGQVTRVFTYFTSEQAQESILSFLNGKAIDLTDTPLDQLEEKIKEDIASALVTGVSL